MGVDEKDRTERLTHLLVHLIGHRTCVGYVVALTDDTTLSITCLACGWTSFSLSDVAAKYCGHCHRWHESGVEGGRDRTEEPFLRDVHSVQKPGEMALAVTVENNRLVVNFGTQIDWLGLDKAHLDIFIATLTEKGKELR